MNLIEITYTKIKYIIRKFPRKGDSLFLIDENKTKRNSGRSMLNQSKEVLCICVLSQESQDSVTNVYDMEQTQERMFMTYFFHIGRHFKTV